MTSEWKDHRSDKRRSDKHKSAKSKPNQVTEWSEWIWHGNQRYQYRNNEYGELEYNINPGTALNNYSQEKGYNKHEEPRFGAPPSGSQCGCGNAGCASNSGCVSSTKFGEPEQENRQQGGSQNTVAPIPPPSSPYQGPRPRPHPAPTYPSTTYPYQMSYTGDDRDQQQEHSITGSAPYVATTYSSNAVPGNPWNDARNNRFDSEYTDQISYTTNQAPYTTNSGILQTFQQLSLQQNELYGSDTSDDDFQGYSSLATRHLPMDSDHGTVFGRICKEMGLLKEDYWKDPSRYQKPASYWNGERLQNNCVFVSIGYLLGMPSEELSTYLQAKPLCAQLQGIDLGDIERILYRIPGLNIVTFPIHPESSHNWGSQHLESQQRFALSKLTKYLKGSDREFAVGYQRGIKNGHCVVAQKLRRRDGTRMEDYQFTCFQHETDGRDMSEDVRKSFISFAIFVDRGSNHRALNCFYECTPQRNGSGTAASTDHVMLYDDGSNSTTSNYQHPTDYNCPSTSYSASNSISVASASEYPRTTSSKTTKHRKNRK